MGPRNTRRVAWVGATLAAVAFVAATVWLTRPNHRQPRSAANGTQLAGAASSGKAASSDEGHAAHTFYERGHVVGRLVYGMTKQQVLRRVGRPVKIIRWQGMSCWQYTVNEHVPASAVDPGYTLNASAACFLAGRYSVPRYKIDGKWGYALLTKTVTD